MPLLVVLADIVEQPRFAQLPGVELERVHPHQQPVAAGVVGAVAEQEVEHARRDRVELLQRRHHLGTRLGELELAGGGLLHLLVILVEDAHGFEGRRPAPQDLEARPGDRLGRGHREYCDGPDSSGGERNQHSSGGHGRFSLCGSLHGKRACSSPGRTRMVRGRSRRNQPDVDRAGVSSGRGSGRR